MISRRALVRILASAGCAPAPASARPDDGVAACRHLLAALPHREDWAAIGRAACAAAPWLCRDDVRAISQALLTALGVPAGRARTMGARLPHVIADDFEQGRVTSVQGWRLARTELLVSVVAARLQEAG